METQEVNDVSPEATGAIGTTDAPIATDTTETTQPESLVSANEDATWFYGDNMAGIGNAPEWFKGDRYKSVSDQAKAYVELEKKFGSFTGAPKDGYALPEGLDSTDALVQEVQKFAVDSNMSQDGFTKLVDLAMTQADVTKQVSMENEMAQLGDNAKERISRVDGFLKNNLESSEYDELAPLLTTASHIELTEKLISLTSQQSLPVDEIVTPEGITFDQMMTEQMRKDENGNYLMNVDLNHKKKVDRMRMQLEAMEKNRK